MTKILGWGEIGIISTLRDVNNPRQLVVEAHDLGKSSIAHIFSEVEESRWKVSVCGEARMLHSGLMDNNETYWKTTPEQIKLLQHNSLLCPVCLKVWNEENPSEQVFT
jgi:hypothetical protein